MARILNEIEVEIKLVIANTNRSQLMVLGGMKMDDDQETLNIWRQLHDLITDLEARQDTINLTKSLRLTVFDFIDYIMSKWITSISMNKETEHLLKNRKLDFSTLDLFLVISEDLLKSLENSDLISVEDIEKYRAKCESTIYAFIQSMNEKCNFETMELFTEPILK